MVAEAGTADTAFAKGDRCPNRQATSLNRAPSLHQCDEPLLLCRTSLTPLIGRQPPPSTPQPRNLRPGRPVKSLSVTQAESAPAPHTRFGDERDVRGSPADLTRYAIRRGFVEP